MKNAENQKPTGKQQTTVAGGKRLSHSVNLCSSSAARNPQESCEAAAASKGFQTGLFWVPQTSQGEIKRWGEGGNTLYPARGHACYKIPFLSSSSSSPFCPLPPPPPSPLVLVSLVYVSSATYDDEGGGLVVWHGGLEGDPFASVCIFGSVCLSVCFSLVLFV